MKVNITFSCLMIYLISNSVFADSTMLQPQASQPAMVPQQLHSNVNTRDCTNPIQSAPYVIIAGVGGADMNLSCPADHPVMYSWRQQVGFVGILSVQGGGGASSVKCCAMKQEWQPAPKIG